MKPHPSMHSRVREYLAHRRKLGFVLEKQGDHLRKFAVFADRVASGQPITTALALEWATSVGDNQLGYHAMRYQAVRGLAQYLAAVDSRTEIPSSRLLGSTAIRRAPHIFSLPQIRLMMRQARQLPHRNHYAALRPLTFEAMVGLMFCAGLRPAELFKLRLADFDPRARTILVRQTKCSPERILPLHPSAVRALERYQKARRRIIPFGEHFFVCRGGAPFDSGRVGEFFGQVTRNIAANGARVRLRFEDLRHTFATRRIAAWSRRKKPVPHYLVLLSRYMGHKQFNATWWYVSPETSSLQRAAQLFQNFQHDKTSNDF